MESGNSPVREAKSPTGSEKTPGKATNKEAPYDPGWNDPPKFEYNPSETTPKVKLNLNKRVAFPMTQPPGSASNRTTELAPSGLPMPHSKNAPPLVIPTQSGQSCDQITAPPSLPPPPPSTLIRPPSTADVVAPAVQKLSPDDLQPRAVGAIEFLIQAARDNSLEEIYSRLEACQKEVEAHTLSPDVLKLLVRVNEALVDRQTEEALKCQQLLMVNHISQCSLWGPAIKRLIISTSGEEQQQQQQQSLSPEEQSNRLSVQYFQPQSVDVPLLPPQEPTVSPLTATSTATAHITDDRADSEEKPSSGSLFQKLKSRILHV